MVAGANSVNTNPGALVTLRNLNSINQGRILPRTGLRPVCGSITRSMTLRTSLLPRV